MQEAEPSAPSYEYETWELYARCGENQIYGVIYIPQGAGEKKPAVIFSHGFGGNYSVGTNWNADLPMPQYTFQKRGLA